MDENSKREETSNKIVYETVVFSGSGTPQTIREPVNLLSVGDTLCDSYILRVRLGQGGMGEVWRADEVYEGKVLRPVVIKTVSPNIQNMDEELARVKAMFHRIHGLQHQHICPMYAMKNDAKHGTIIVMKYIEGIELQTYREQYMKLHDTFPMSEAVRLLLPIAQALDYAHQKRVLHRDVKPQNIMVCDESGDGVQLIDFGLVADLLTSVTTNTQTHFDTSGTLPYMSPEQWGGEYQDGQTDQFSLAVVMYELLSGNLPFLATNIQVLGFQILNKTPDPIEGLPDYTNRALLKALSKNRKDRFDTCENFIRALETPAEPESESKAAEETPQKSWKLPAMVGGGVLAAILLVVLVAMALSGSKPEVAQNTQETPCTQEPETSEVPKAVETVPPAETPQPAPEAAPVATPEPVEVVEPKKDPEPEVVEPEVVSEPAEVAEPVKTPEPAETPEVVETPEPETTPEPEVTPEVEETPEPEQPAEVDYRAQGLEQLAAEDFANAFASLTQALAAAPDDVELLKAHVAAAEKTGHWESAKADYLKLIQLQPGDEQRNEQFLRACMQAKDYFTIVDLVNLQLADDPENVEWLKVRSTALSELASKDRSLPYFKKAQADFDHLIALEPENAEWYARRGYAHFRNSYVSRALEHAKEDFEKALQLDPNCEAALVYQGIYLRDALKQNPNALANFAKAVQVNPKNGFTFYQRAVTFFNMKEYDQALDMLKTALSLLPEDILSLTQRGLVYQAKGQMTEAIADFTAVLSYHPDDFAVRKHRADCSLAKDLLVDAKNDYEYLLKNDPNRKNHVAYNFQMSELYKKGGRRMDAARYEDAARALKRELGM